MNVFNENKVWGKRHIKIQVKDYFTYARLVVAEEATYFTILVNKVFAAIFARN